MNKLIGIGASYDFDLNPGLKAAKKYLKDIRKGSSLTTIPIYRGSIGSIDNLKFMYPLGQNQVPIVAYTLLNAVDQYQKVRVTGNKEVKALSELMNDLFNTNIEFRSEGDQEKLSLSNTFIRLFGENRTNENLFVTGDIPFAKNYCKTNYEGDVVLDFNTGSLLRNLPNTKRNFYNEGQIGDRADWFKEPNVYFFTDEGFPALHDMADHFYKNRKAGGLPRALASYLYHKYKTDKKFKKPFKKNMKDLGIELATAVAQNYNFDVDPLNFDKDNKIISELFNIDWRFEFIHDDVFRMLDVDGLNNDFIVTDGIARNLESADKLDGRLIKLGEAIQSEINYFPLIANFEEMILEYGKQIDENLPDEHKLEIESMEEFRKKYQEKEKGSIDELTEVIIKAE